MTDPADEPSDAAPHLFADKLTICRAFWFDNRQPEKCYSLGGLITHIGPPQDYTFPFSPRRLFVYFRYWGTPGDYRFRIRFVRIEATVEGEEEIHLGPDGGPWEFPCRPTARPKSPV